MISAAKNLFRSERQNSHENRISDHLRELRVRENCAVDRNLIILSFVNRSGSNLFGEYLSSLKGFSGFREELNADYVVKQCEVWNVNSFPEYIRRISSRRTEQNWGVKASAHQIQMLSKWQIFSMFNHVKALHIERHDIISQAVSLWIAKHTHQWSSRQQAKTSEETVPYNYDWLARLCEDIEKKNLDIKLTLRALGISTHAIHYERLISHPSAEMRRVGEFLEIDLSQWTPPPKTQHEKQTSQVKKDFIQRFRKDLLESWY